MEEPKLVEERDLVDLLKLLRAFLQFKKARHKRLRLSKNATCYSMCLSAAVMSASYGNTLVNVPQEFRITLFCSARLDRYIEANPSRKSTDPDGFWWPRSEYKQRLEWLNYHIRKNSK